MAKERLDREIVLEEAKTKAVQLANEYKVKLRALEIEAEEKKRKDELSRIEAEYRGRCELEKAQIEKLRLEMELMKMKKAQEDETAAANKPTEGDNAPKKQNFKGMAKKTMREVRGLKAWMR